jgi:hypothetical protein
METIDSAPWRKSTYSGTNGGSCVEAADMDGRILVRDTADRGGVALSISTEAWLRFTANTRLVRASPRSGGAASNRYNELPGNKTTVNRF